MAADRKEHLQQSLALLDAESTRVRQIAKGLSDADWAKPSNCPPWPVKMILAHLARSAEGFRIIVEHGLRGEMNPPQSQEERERRMRELAELPPAALIDKFDETQQQFRDTMAAIPEADLERYCPHNRGPQPAWWMADQRLSELAFHGWDIDFSLGRDREISSETAEFLLPTLMERNIRTWYQAGPAGYGHFLIRPTGGQSGWIISPSDGGVNITPGSGEADVTIEGDAAALIRFLYGRAKLADLEQSGRITVSGQRWRADAWHVMFPAP